MSNVIKRAYLVCGMDGQLISGEFTSKAKAIAAAKRWVIDRSEEASIFTLSHVAFPPEGVPTVEVVK